MYPFLLIWSESNCVLSVYPRTRTSKKYCHQIRRGLGEKDVPVFWLGSIQTEIFPGLELCVSSTRNNSTLVYAWCKTQFLTRGVPGQCFERIWPYIPFVWHQEWSYTGVTPFLCVCDPWIKKKVWTVLH